MITINHDFAESQTSVVSYICNLQVCHLRKVKVKHCLVVFTLHWLPVIFRTDFKYWLLACMVRHVRVCAL